MNNTHADSEGRLANLKLTNSDMLVDDYEHEQYNNDRQEVVNITPEDDATEEPEAEEPVLLADDCMFDDHLLKTCLLLLRPLSWTAHRTE